MKEIEKIAIPEYLRSLIFSKEQCSQDEFEAITENMVSSLSEGNINNLFIWKGECTNRLGDDFWTLGFNTENSTEFIDVEMNVFNLITNSVKNKYDEIGRYQPTDLGCSPYCHLKNGQIFMLNNLMESGIVVLIKEKEARIKNWKFGIDSDSVNDSLSEEQISILDQIGLVKSNGLDLNHKLLFKNLDKFLSIARLELGYNGLAEMCTEYMGIDIKEISFKGHGKLFCKQKEIGGEFYDFAYIIINENLNIKEKFYVLAHEFSHFIFHRDQILIFQKIDEAIQYKPQLNLYMGEKFNEATKQIYLETCEERSDSFASFILFPLSDESLKLWDKGTVGGLDSMSLKYSWAKGFFHTNEQSIGFNHVTSLKMESFKSLFEYSNMSFPMDAENWERMLWCLINRQEKVASLKARERKITELITEIIFSINEDALSVSNNQESEGYLNRLSMEELNRKIQSKYEFWDDYILTHTELIDAPVGYVRLKPNISHVTNSIDCTWVVLDNPTKYPALLLNEWVSMCAVQNRGIIVSPITPHDTFTRRQVYG